MLAVGVVEAPHGTARKAHGLEDLRTARVAVGNGVARHRRLPGGKAETLRHDFANDGQNRKHKRTGERQRTQSRMQKIDKRQIDRHPWQVEQRRRPLATEEAANRIDVPSPFEGFGGRETETRHVDCHSMRHRRHLLIEPSAYPHQHLGANDVEATLEEIQADDQARKDEKRRNAAAGQRPVVDLHHVQ